MTFDEMKQFIHEVAWGHLATSDGTKVGVRPMGGIGWFEGELWAATGRDTDKVAQLKAVPHAEYCFARPDGAHLRLAGPCTVSTDDGDKKKLWDACPMLKQFIPDPADPGYVVLRLKPERARFMPANTMAYEDIAL